LYRQDLNQPPNQIRGIRTSSGQLRKYWIDLQEDSRKKNGVGVRYEANLASILVDMTRNTSDFNDYPLAASQTFTDTEQEMEIEVADWGGSTPETQFAKIDVRYLGAPTIVQPAEGGIYIAGQPRDLAVVATGTLPLFYQWYKDGVPLPGEQHAEIFAHATVPE